MSRHSLTDLSVRKLAARETGRYDVWDTRVPGLGIRVFKSGVKSFFLSYRMHGKRRRDTLGRYPEIGLAEVRQLAYERRAQIARGEDPVVTVKMKALNFEKVVASFIELHIERHNKPSTQDLYRMIIRNEFLPVWRNRPIVEIGRQDIVVVLDAIMARGSPGAANNTYALISKFFNWCVSRGLIEMSPCTGVERPAKLKSRDRVLLDGELSKVWSASRVVGYPFGTILMLLILTGQRRGEVANMEWGQIDEEEKIWHLPATLTKNKKPHSLPLPDLVLDILWEAGQINGQKFVFPAQGSKTTTFSGFSKSKRRFGGMVEIDEWRLHDLRRTAATGMAKLEVPPHVIERVLNHSTGQLGGIAGIYNRFQYMDEMRDALEKWSAHVMALQSEK